MTSRTSALLVILLFGSFFAHAEGTDFSLFPGFYATYGDYSDSRTSENIAAYSTVAFSRCCFWTVGYDNILIEHDEFAFRQQIGIGGILLTTGHWGGKIHYGRIVGKFRLHNADDRLRDETNLYSGELLFQRPAFVLGLAYTQQDLKYMIREEESPSFDGSSGVKQRSQQFTARAEVVLDPRVRLIYLPTYTWVLDGRRLHSAALKVNYLPISRLLLRGGAAYGERAYYYDNDLLTVYNQHETQQSLWFVRADFSVWKSWEIVAEYIDTRLSGYSIRYTVLGLKTNFEF